MSNDIEKAAGTSSPEKIFEVVGEFIKFQEKELEVRQQEIQVKSRDLDNQKEIALAAIKAQKEDRKESRETYQAESTKGKIFAFSIISLLVVLTPLALVWLGQKTFAEEYIKYILAIGFSAFGGYGFAIKSMRNED